jgi:hypothetical protein
MPSGAVLSAASEWVRFKGSVAMCGAGDRAILNRSRRCQEHHDGGARSASYYDEQLYGDIVSSRHAKRSPRDAKGGERRKLLADRTAANCWNLDKNPIADRRLNGGEVQSEAAERNAFATRDWRTTNLRTLVRR